MYACILLLLHLYHPSLNERSREDGARRSQCDNCDPSLRAVKPVVHYVVTLQLTQELTPPHPPFYDLHHPIFISRRADLE